MATAQHGQGKLMKISAGKLAQNLNEFFNTNLSSEQEKLHNRLLRIVSVCKEDFVTGFIGSFSPTIYVIDINRSTVELHAEHVKWLDNPYSALLFLRIMDTHIHHYRDIKVNVELRKYNHKSVEAFSYFNSLTTVLAHSTSSYRVDLSSLDELLQDKNHKTYAKGARKSVTGTLLGISSDKTFRPHYKTKYGIVSIENLGKKLNLGSKEGILRCPICGTRHRITKNNINKVIVIKGKKFVFICPHVDTNHIGEDYFSANLSPYLPNKYSVHEIRMFVLNNFEKLVKG